MKVLIIANKCKWKSWDKKIQEQKDWWSPVVDFQFTLRHTNFKKIPFNEEMIDNDWYDTNIAIPAKKEGFDIVIFSLRDKDWKVKKFSGWKTAVNLGIQEIQMGSDEKSTYYFNGKKFTGDKWFHLARHELAHAMYNIRGLQDNTHYYWDNNMIDKVLGDFKANPRNAFIMTVINQMGVTEVLGPKHNPTILKYFHEAGFAYVKDDETAWCSAFMNWCAMQVKLPRSGALNARSWLYVGKDTKTPAIGDLAVFWRGSKDGWEGHVGMYFGKVGDQIQVLGGNQGNKVQVSLYPAKQLLGFRNIIN